jgi:outer membrane protein assembly factor BamB
VGGLTVDTQGNAWLGGTSAGFTLGAQPLPEGPFVARLSPRGAVERVRGFTGEGTLAMQALAADGADGVVLVGDFSGHRDFGDGVREATGRGAFAVRLGPDGATRWSRAWSSSAEGLVSARAVAVDVFGAVHVAGAYAGAVGFGGPAFVTVRQRAPFVLKLSADGAHLWSRDLRGAEGSATAVAVGPDRVYVGGTFSGRFYFQSQAHASGSPQGFVAAYSAEGRERWARSFAASASALATDEAGQLTLAGTHDGGLDLGPGRATAPAGLFVARLLPEDGASVWVRGFTSPTGAPAARALAVDASGHAVVAGALPRTLPEGTPYPRPRDGFLVRLRP